MATITKTPENESLAVARQNDLLSSTQLRYFEIEINTGSFDSIRLPLTYRYFPIRIYEYIILYVSISYRGPNQFDC